MLCSSLLGAVPFRFLAEADQPVMRLWVQMQQSRKQGHSSYEKYAALGAHMSCYLCAYV
jgi:hypothetical protein